MSSRTRTQNNILASKKVQTSLVEVNVGRGPEPRVLTKICLSKGEHLALLNALEQHSKISPVGADVFAYLQNAMIEADIVV